MSIRSAKLLLFSVIAMFPVEKYRSFIKF